MITVGCAGFAVPATRYFKEYQYVEINDTFKVVPGPGTVRRWRREANEEFEFALLGPREIAADFFRPGPIMDQSIANLMGVAETLRATIGIFNAPADFGPTDDNQAALKDFLVEMRKKFKRVVFDLGSHWDGELLDRLAEDTDTLAARDPLHQGLSERPIGYYRLPGPAGHKSRYEDPVIEDLALIAESAGHKSAHYIFTNVDMFADGKRFKKALGI